MHYYDLQVVLQEVPGEIALCFSITGCPLHCEGCHSSYLWKKNNGMPLTKELFSSLLNQYQGLASCILFMGGEWHQEKLISLLQLANNKKYKTCLYTGEDHVPNEILEQLTWIKTGKWDYSLGGLESSSTNQKFIEVKTNRILNHLFNKKTTQYDTPHRFTSNQENQLY